MFTPILAAVVFGLILLTKYLPSSSLGLDENPYLASVVIQLLTYALPALFYCRMRGSAISGRLRLCAFPPSRLLYIWHAAVFMLCGTTLLSILMYSLYPESFEAASAVKYASFAMNGRFFDGLYLVAVFACLPALTEELLFRGIVIGEYDRYGAGAAAVVSAVMFAMSHFSLVRFPVYFFAGIVLALITYASRSVLASVLVHAVYNAVALLSEDYVFYMADRQNVSLVLLILILGALFVISGMLMCYEAQSVYRDYSEKCLPSDYAAQKKKSFFGGIGEVFFSPTFLLLIIMFVVASMT